MVLWSNMKVNKHPKLKVLVVDCSRNYRNLIESMGHEVSMVNRIDDAAKFNYCDVDVVLFTGGADVNPKLYGHTQHPTTIISELSDELCLTVFNKAKQDNPTIKFAGICRGSQFLCVMAGGKLVQDLQGHAVYGTHETIDYEGASHEVTSTHHQMQYPCDVQHKVLAASVGLSKNPQMHIDGQVVPVDLPMDYEAVWYPGIKALAFQPHPEFGGADSTKKLFVKLFNQFIVYGLTLVK